MANPRRGIAWVGKLLCVPGFAVLGRKEIHPSSRPRWSERTARNHREPGSWLVLHLARSRTASPRPVRRGSTSGMTGGGSMGGNCDG